MFCRKCGKQIPDDSEFCYKCGTPVITAGDHTETSKKETVSLEKEKPKPPEEKHLQQDKPPEETHVITPDKKEGSEEQSKESSSVCPTCGSKLLNPTVTYCPYCSMKIIREKSTQLPITSTKCIGCGELVYSNQRSCHNCGATNPEYNSRFDNIDAYDLLSNNSSSNKNTRYSQAQTSNSPASDEDVIHKCRNCGKKVGNNQRTCPKCGTANPHYDPEFEAKINDTVNRAMANAVNEVQNDYSCSEEYESLKKGTLIALYVIMGIVVLFCMATGQLAFLGCPSPIEYEVGYTTNGMLTIIWWAIGLNIARAIFLCICKATHK